MKILFLHGWQSTPGGLKPTYLKDHRHDVLNPALPDDDFDAAVSIAQDEFDQGKPDVVVGSSRGGAVAMDIDAGTTPLVLLCPAWKRWGRATTVKPNTIILHSRADETVPFADSEELVRNSGLPSSVLVEVGMEHRLADPGSLTAMLRASTCLTKENQPAVLVPIGCDVGPKKGGHLFDGGEIKPCNPQEVVDKFSTLRSRREVLVAWDSPLTGPHDPSGKLRGDQDLSQRPIEKFFRSNEWNFKAPEGISVLPYSGCSHWTISQRVLGLPRIGAYSLEHERLPFHLVCNNDQQSAAHEKKASIVEVHPAVAIWMWYLRVQRRTDDLRYKGSKLTAQIRRERVQTHWRLICEHVDGTQGLPKPSNDDELDCIVAWLLARNWIIGADVLLLGNERTGCFLVPEVECLLEKFQEFQQSTG